MKKIKKLLTEKDLIYSVWEGGYHRGVLTSLGKELYDASTQTIKTKILDLRRVKTLYQVITFQTIEIYNSSIIGDETIYVTLENTGIGDLVELYRTIKNFINKRIS